MAVYRQVHVSFWQDSDVLDLTPEEKYFYLYLLTCSKTTQCGIYELPMRIMELELGYNRETVEKLIKRFIEYGKILYNADTKEVMLLNWIKHNSVKSPAVKSCIMKELKKVKHQEFLQEFARICLELGYDIDGLGTVYRPSEDSHQTVRGDSGEEKEEEKEKNKKKNPYRFYEENGFGTISLLVSEKINDWIDTGGFEEAEEIVVQAMEEAVLNNKRTWSYVNSILQEWSNKGVKTVADVVANKAEFEARKQKSVQKQVEGTIEREYVAIPPVNLLGDDD